MRSHGYRLQRPPHKRPRGHLIEPLDGWVQRQYRHSAVALLLSVSPTHTRKTRDGFAQTMK
jgi:hypothetical protein